MSLTVALVVGLVDCSNGWGVFPSLLFFPTFRISEHVLRMHRYRNPGEQDGEALPMGGSDQVLVTGDGEGRREEEEVDTPIFEKHDHLLHGKSNR